jgi:SAM-dependent methyltransferase
MSAASIVCAIFAGLWTLDALRLRGRARALSVLAPSEQPVSSDHCFIVRPGATLDDATRRAASAFARDNDLDVLDLVPADLPAWNAMVLLQSVDVARFRKDRLAKGRTAGTAILVRTSLLERMHARADDVADPIAFAHLAARLKLHACTQTDFAIAPSLRAVSERFVDRSRLFGHAFSDLAVPVGLAQIAFALAAPWLSPIAGGLALAAMHLQAALALLGTRLAPRDIALHTLLRSPVDFASLFASLVVRPPQPKPDPVEMRRPEYADLLAAGTPRFFEPRRTDCPVCKGQSLSHALSTGDRYQFKPGRFTLDRCRDCEHVFQNPRLSIEGLDFYYRDFYDGLGEERLEGIFGSQGNPYVARAKIVAGSTTPARWLDVGAGHGHFCCVARDVWPEARFDGLDLSESIDDAVRRRWVDRGFKGLFPELAPTITEKYDVVSMSHYLEHTRDPAAEIEAAAKVLPQGGYLMIELPDPDSRVGRVLGAYWLPWFQPQHQHLLSTRNLERILRANAFEPLVWHRGEAHQTIDLTAFVVTLVSQIARPIDLPWHAPTSLRVRAWHRVTWWAAIPFLGVSWLLDRLLAPLMRREGWSNTYRVLARRTA